MEDLANDHPEAEVSTVGTTEEGRNITLLTICKGGCGWKTAVYLDASKFIIS